MTLKLTIRIIWRNKILIIIREDVSVGLGNNVAKSLIFVVGEIIKIKETTTLSIDFLINPFNLN